MKVSGDQTTFDFEQWPLTFIVKINKSVRHFQNMLFCIPQRKIIQVCNVTRVNDDDFSFLEELSVHVLENKFKVLRTKWQTVIFWYTCLILINCSLQCSQVGMGQSCVRIEFLFNVVHLLKLFNSKVIKHFILQVE